MYFTNPIKKFEARSSGLMSTHPPILDRINRLRELTGEAAARIVRGGRAGLDWASAGPRGEALRVAR